MAPGKTTSTMDMGHGHAYLVRNMKANSKMVSGMAKAECNGSTPTKTNLLVAKNWLSASENGAIPWQSPISANTKTTSSTEKVK